MFLSDNLESNQETNYIFEPKYQVSFKDPSRSKAIDYKLSILSVREDNQPRYNIINTVYIVVYTQTRRFSL
jgi:hypothetical protein